MIAMWSRIGLVAALVAALASCTRPPLPVADPVDREAIAASLTRDIAVLASEEFGGRKPGTDGEVRTIGFLIDEMRKAGLESGTNDPGNPWRAPVGLIDSEPMSSRVAISINRREIELSKDQAVAFTTLRRALVEAGEMVFVGRLSSEVPPEMVRGNVVVMLGEPGVSPARRDTLFGFDPAAIITIVETQASIDAIKRVNQRARLYLGKDDTTRLSAFATQDEFAAAIGEDVWTDLVIQSQAPDFEARSMTATATVEASSKRREFTSYNVIGRLPGLLPESGAIIVLAHWDHLGECGAVGAEDRLCNGAVDNASGLAVMLELARRLAAGTRFDRDIYFMGTTAEEAGLLGIRGFVDTPAVPLDSVVAAFNFDTVAVAPAGSPVGFIGEGRTPLDPVIQQVIEDMDRTLGSRVLAQQFLQRQDNWALLQEGVPAVVLSSTFGSQVILDPYLSEHYHSPSDEVEVIELGGAIDDLLLHEELIRRVADSAAYPSP